jgi:hypothetical protein
LGDEAKALNEQPGDAWPNEIAAKYDHLVALVFGAEVNAEIERAKEISEGVPEQETLNLPTGRRRDDTVAEDTR